MIAGDGPRKARLQEQIERGGLSGVVQLLGYCDDVLTVLEALDVFVLSSRREGLPNVVLEAMAAQTPVVATRIAGVPKVLTDQVDGLLIEPENLESLIAGLSRCLADAELRHRLGQAGREDGGPVAKFPSSHGSAAGDL